MTKNKTGNANAVKNSGWHFNKRLDLSVVAQLILLASLILTSWLNLQTRLELIRRDVTILLESNEKLQLRIESLWEASISHEYRIRTLEKEPDPTVSLYNPDF